MSPQLPLESAALLHHEILGVKLINPPAKISWNWNLNAIFACFLLFAKEPAPRSQNGFDEEIPHEKWDYIPSVGIVSL
jgi:hypothetical protein